MKDESQDGAATAAPSLIDAALRYLPRTVPLIGKRPPMRDWPNWPAHPATVRSWWTTHPTSNIGIRCGDGLAVVDIDPRDGGDIALQQLELEHGKLPETPEVATGGNGRHLYFRAPRDLRSYTLAPGLELKAHGRQVVAPPSTHPGSGKLYVWVRPLVESEIAELPRWLAGRHGHRDDRRDHAADPSRAGDALMSIPATVYVPALTGRLLGRDGKLECPFHEDWNPSLHCYEGAGGWYCFQCSRGGSIIDLGAALWGLEPRGGGYFEIRRRLAVELLSVAA